MFRKLNKLYMLELLKKKLPPRLNILIQQFLWRYRHIFLPKRMSDFGEKKGIRRTQTLNIIKSKGSFTNLLEIGCGNGISIDLLSKNIPNSHFTGMDLNKKIIEENKVRTRKIKNCEFINGNINNLNNFENNYYDYILLESVLIYIEPKKLKNLILELIRIAKKGIILREQSVTGGLYDSHYIHDFPKLFDELNLKNFSKSKALGQGGLWNKYGYIFDINL